MLEYLEHLKTLAIEQSAYNFVFCIPKTEDSAGFFVHEYENIEAYDLSELTKMNYSRFNFSKTWLLRKMIHRFQATDVVLISYDQYFPAFHFLLPRNVNYVSFLYYLYIYDWKKLSIKDKIRNVVNYFLLVNNRAVSQILICNGSNERILLNKIYKTRKFVNIVDPISIDVTHSTKKKHTKKTFLHLGVLGIRKGTLEILDAITMLNAEQCDKVRFIFAGIVTEEIKQVFYEHVEVLKSKVEICIADRFCSYHEIINYCQESDFLLMPYSGTSQSSGMLAYASAFNLPVIATDKGMIKKLVKKNRLGYLIQNDSNSIRDMVVKLMDKAPMQVSRVYVEKNSIEEFNNTFRTCFNS